MGPMDEAEDTDRQGATWVAESHTLIRLGELHQASPSPGMEWLGACVCLFEANADGVIVGHLQGLTVPHISREEVIRVSLIPVEKYPLNTSGEARFETKKGSEKSAAGGASKSDHEEREEFAVSPRASTLLSSVARLVALPPDIPGRPWIGATTTLLAGDRSIREGHARIVRQTDKLMSESRMLNYTARRLTHQIGAPER